MEGLELFEYVNNYSCNYMDGSNKTNEQQKLSIKIVSIQSRENVVYCIQLQVFMESVYANAAITMA